MAARRDPERTWPPDAALVERLIAGEDSAYETLLRQEGPRLLRAARRMCGEEQDARDAVQETFLAAFRSLERFEGRSRLRTWLYGILMNTVLTLRRRRRARPETPIEDLLPRFVADGHRANPQGAWNHLDSHKQRAETLTLVREALEQLPEGYREVVLLRDVEGFDTAETAEIMQTTPGAVKVRLHRARQALRELIDPKLARGRGERC